MQPIAPDFLWVVEMRDGTKWLPTVGCGLSRAEGRREMQNWREDNPNDKYRLRRYRREESSQYPSKEKP